MCNRNFIKKVIIEQSLFQLVIPYLTSHYILLEGEYG